MNKYEEELSEIYSYDGCKLELEDLPLTKELVELHTPKKVIDGVCPNCKLDTGTMVQDYYGDTIRINKFCSNCGQALDWSDR